MGSTARTVAANLRRLREARGMSLRTLSAEMQKIGRTLSADAINKIENGRLLDAGDVSPKQVRRADVDDLVALALALNVSPLTLLLPPTSGSETVPLTDGYQVPGITAWQWGEGLRTAKEYTPQPSADSEPSAAADAHEREQDWQRQQTEYAALTRPPERQRAEDHSAVRAVRQLGELIIDLVSPEPGADRAALAARGRMAQRRHAQIGYDLEEIIEQLPPVHPGVPRVADAGDDES